jgi:calcium-dependent protein kinase
MALDKNGDGKIDRSELMEALSQVKGDEAAASNEVDRILEEVDADGNGEIEYSEFILASMNKKKALSRENLTAAFNRFDQDNSGTITLNELRTILGNFGKNELWD